MMNNGKTFFVFLWLVILTASVQDDNTYELRGKTGYINGMPICGHHFWDSQYGAIGFCKKIGYTGGSFYRIEGVYDLDAIHIGKCNNANQFPNNCEHRYRQGINISVCKKGQRMSVGITCTHKAPLWLPRGKGRCPEAKNFGHESTEHSTEEQCRNKCEEYHESYFSLWTAAGSKTCGCYTDCDALDTSVDDAESYEILSVTVRAELEKKKNEIQAVKNQNTGLDSQVNDLTVNLSTCNSEKTTCTTNLQSKANELTEMTSDREVWKNRFQEVQRLDAAIVHHSDMAMKKFPDQAAVGNAMEQCNTGSIPSFMDRLVFLCIGAGLYAILNKTLVQKNRGDEYNSMLEI